MLMVIIVVFLYLFVFAQLPRCYRATFLKCLASLFGIVPKFLLIDHRGHRYHREVYLSSWECVLWIIVKFCFTTKLTELIKLQDRTEVGSRRAEVLWLFGFATRLFHEPYKLIG